MILFFLFGGRGGEKEMMIRESLDEIHGAYLV